MAPTPADRQSADFGPKLTRDDYERRIVALHEGAQPMPDAERERRTRRGELDLLIDYRLGQRFPDSRREALWQAQERLDKRRLWHLLAGMLAHPTDPSAAVARAQVRGFAKVLAREELGELLDLALEDLQRLL
ncbi:hypothetical protein [Lysobacter enzymogenes]|uniref:Uncharacterized protein n=1 Tax=Lysobacter enzymogenes TaxID=69 RepID=A0AAU9B2B4_LYSEN|nr:hypothetical protein [Lysobacter enzymogenes]BAV99391.1 hypothetical protein LEN_3904 [Lysobacter enzymogenes]